VRLGRTFGVSWLAGLALGAGMALRAPGPAPAAYTAAPGTGDTLRVRLASTRDADRRGRAALTGLVAGYLSPRGLPPISGAIALSDTGLVFRSTDGSYAIVLPVVGPIRQSAGSRWRASAVSLAYVDDALGHPSYLFRMDSGVFETDAPGALLEVAAHPEWLDSLGSTHWRVDRALVDPADEPAVRALLDTITGGPYADSLYAIFGHPERTVGVVGARGRAAGRLGEYIASRASLALDPGRMASVEQLRHTLAHELAHRWQARSAAQLSLLWKGVPSIRDPKRYGYGNTSEQQAEAAAFAVHFLLATAGSRDPTGDTARLDHYDLLVPGTRTLVRYYAMQPGFRGHPLRMLLTTERSEK
jgi:hypothetical protein